MKNAKYINHNPSVESSIILIFGLCAYITCELVHFSGVISILVCGIVLGHYNIYNLSD